MTSGSRGTDFRLFNSESVKGKFLLKKLPLNMPCLQRTTLYFRIFFFVLSANSSLQYAGAVRNNRKNKTILGAGVMVLDNWKASVHKDRWACLARKSLILVWSQSRSDYQLCVKSLSITCYLRGGKKWKMGFWLSRIEGCQKAI